MIFVLYLSLFSLHTEFLSATSLRTNFHEAFLKWKLQNGPVIENCFAINFDYFDPMLSIPQISITLDKKMELNLPNFMNVPSNCFIVIIGGKYLNLIDDVMRKVNSVTNDFVGGKTLAIFLLSNSYNENLALHVTNTLDGLKSTPVMVKLKYQDT